MSLMSRSSYRALQPEVFRVARIDSLIRHLFEFGGEALGIGSGHQVMLVTQGERRPITAAAIQEAQVESLLTEIAPTGDLGRLAQNGEHQFDYRSPSGAVSIKVTRGNGVRLVVTRERPAEAPPPPAVEPERKVEAPSEEFSMAKTGATQIPPELHAAPAPVREAAVGPPTFQSPPLGAQAIPVDSSTSAGPTTTAAADKRLPLVRPDIPTPTPGNCALDPLLRAMVERRGSDLYVCTGKPPIIRRDGDLVALGDTQPLSDDEVQRLLYSIAHMGDRQRFVADNDVDFAYELPGVARFRVNIFRDRMGVGGILRQIPSKILSSEELNLPRAVMDFCNLNKGLVVVTGPTGSGKSTTLAAMIDHINRTQSVHMITIEDPIEFVHQDKRAVVNQREIGNHTKGFKRALRAALREDPDIVLVGEMRDLETIEIAIETAETGHLVFGTLHTNTAHSTVDRIIDQFSSDRQSQIRTMLSEALRGVVAQTLCKKKGGGRVAALEIMVVTQSVSNIIREGKTFQLPSVMQTGKNVGMVTLNDSLINLVKEGVVEPREALNKAVDKNDFKNVLARNNITLD
jgi:twitching motility protein PilT